MHAPHLTPPESPKPRFTHPTGYIGAYRPNGNSAQTLRSTIRQRRNAWAAGNIFRRDACGYLHFRSLLESSAVASGETVATSADLGTRNVDTDTCMLTLAPLIPPTSKRCASVRVHIPYQHLILVLCV